MSGRNTINARVVGLKRFFSWAVSYEATNSPGRSAKPTESWRLGFAVSTRFPSTSRDHRQRNGGLELSGTIARWFTGAWELVELSVVACAGNLGAQTIEVLRSGAGLQSASAPRPWYADLRMTPALAHHILALDRSRQQALAGGVKSEVKRDGRGSGQGDD